MLGGGVPHSLLFLGPLSQTTVSQARMHTFAFRNGGLVESGIGSSSPWDLQHLAQGLACSEAS